MARGPQLRSAPLALPSVRDATHCVIFAQTFNTQLRFGPTLLSASSDLCTSAPPPSPQPSSRGIVGRRLRQLRYCVADFPHYASHALQSCGVVGVIPSTIGRPSCVRTPSLRQNFSARILHSAAASHTHKSCGTLRDPLSGRLRRPAAGIREFVRTRAAAAQNTRQGQLAALPGLYACVSTVGYPGWMTSRIEALSFIFTAPVRRCRGVSRVQTSSSVPLFPVSFSLPLSFSMLYTSQVQKIRPII